MIGHWEQTFVPDEPCQSQLDYDTCVLGWAVVEMSKYYQEVFKGLDDLLRVINSNAESREGEA